LGTLRFHCISFPIYYISVYVSSISLGLSAMAASILAAGSMNVS
jgi:hypothetical protein